MSFTCKNIDCTAPENKKGKVYPAGMDCPFCDEPLVEVISFSDDDLKLLDSLPYVIAYPLKETLLQNDYEKRLHRLGYTFINFLKYLGLISISEFFNSDLKNRRIVDLFLSQLSEPSFGKWNGFIRECYAALHKEKVELVFPEFYNFYIQIETMDKKFNISEEIIEDFGELNYSKKNGLSSIGMLVHYRNKYLGHGTPINENKAKELWEFYYPIFQTVLLKLIKLSEASLYKRENGIVWKLASSVVSEEKNLNQKIDNDKVWLADKIGRKLSMVPFFIIPSDFGALKNEAQLLVYESYTGSTIKFFSPESIVKETSGEILQRLNLLLREKQKETPFTLEAFTKVDFLKRIVEENKLLLETLIKEKKIIPGVYQHREEMETKLREWIGARASIFFLAAEAGSGKTNLLVEIQKQYTERQLPSLLIRAGRMERQTLKQQIAYLLNIDLEQGLENYSSIEGTQAEPTFILIDGLNEANNAEDIWQEVIELSKLFELGSLKFVVTNRANSKNDLDRYSINEIDNDLLYGENKDNEVGLRAYSFWLTALDMKEMKGAWENYIVKDKSRFKPQFSFDDLATFDRALYNQINNPLILRLFLEIYNGKALPKKVIKYLHIWQDWLKTFSNEEQTFFKLLADEVWLRGDNELLLDDLLKHETLKPYFTSDINSAPYKRLKYNGWISSYIKDLNGYIGFTVEGALFYLLGLNLQERVSVVDKLFIQSVLDNGNKFQKSGIESFLFEESLNGNLDLVIDLIDLGGDKIDICIMPLINNIKVFGVEKTIAKILETPTSNDFIVLINLLHQLEKLQLLSLVKQLSNEIIMRSEILKIDCPINLILEILNFCDLKFKNNLLEIVIDYINSHSNSSSIIAVKRDLASYYRNNNLPEKAVVLYEDILQSQEYQLKKSEHKLPLINQIGASYDLIGNKSKAIENYLKIKEIAEEKPHLHQDLLQQVYFNLAINSSDLDESIRFYEKSLEIDTKLNGKVHLSVAETFSGIGNTYNKHCKYEIGIKYLLNAIDIQVKLGGETYQGLVFSYDAIAWAYNNNEQFEDSLNYYIKAMDAAIFNYGEKSLNVMHLFDCIAGVYYKLENYRESNRFYKKVYDLHSQFNYISETKKLGILFYFLGECNYELESYIDSIDFYKKCYELHLSDDIFGDQVGCVHNILYFLSISYNHLHDYTNAIKYSKLYLEINKEQDTFSNKMLEVIGNSFFFIDEFESAIKYYDILINLNGENQIEKRLYSSYIGSCYFNLKKYQNAINFYIEAIDYEDLNSSILFDISQCYNSLNDKENALKYSIQSAEVRKERLGIVNEATIKSVENLKCIAKELNKENELPDWIKEI